MPHLLHIGMPNCLSRPIQDMFCQDEGNFYLGMEPSDNVPRQIQYAVETELMQVPNHHYNEEIVHNLFRVAVETANENSSGSIILSDDKMADGFSRGGVSFDERLARLRRAMPEDTTVLMVVRDPIAYLKAHYRFLVVKQCLTLSFLDYVKYILVRGSKAFLGLLDFAAHYNAARAHFQDVEIVLYEQLMEDDETLHRLLASKGIKVDTPMVMMDPNAIGDAVAAHFLTLASDQASALSGHPALDLDAGDVDTLAQNSPLFDELMLGHAVRQSAKDAMLEAAQKLAATQPMAEIDYGLDLKTETMLKGYIVQVNKALAQSTGLPLSHFGYDLGEEKGATVAAE